MIPCEEVSSKSLQKDFVHDCIIIKVRYYVDVVRRSRSSEILNLIPHDTTLDTMEDASSSLTTRVAQTCGMLEIGVYQITS